MITINYDAIPALVAAFVKLPSDAQRLTWIAAHVAGAADPRAAGWVLEEYWRNPEIWTAIGKTIEYGKNQEIMEVADDSTLWATYDPATGRRQDGTPFVAWRPKGGAEKEFRDDQKTWHVERIKALPPLERIPGVSRGWWAGNNLMVIDIHLAGLSSASLDAGLDRLISATADMQRLLTIVPREGTLPGECGHLSGDTSMFFCFRFRIGEEFVNEKVFFEHCCANLALDAKVVRFADQVHQDVLRIERGKARWAFEKFQNEEMNPGGYAIVALAQRDRRYVPLLARRIEEWDMDHESWHELVIHRVLDRHGPCEETLVLLAARIGRGAGQSGNQNLQRAFQEPCYRNWLAHGNRLEQMVTRALAPSRQDVLNGRDPLRAFYACSLRLVLAAVCWSVRDAEAYRAFISHAEAALGKDIQYLPEWHEEVLEFATESPGKIFPLKSAETPWDDGCDWWLKQAIPDEEVIPMA